MSFNLYKPGQGYWTRLLSGIGGGVVAFATALWVADKLVHLKGDYIHYIRLAVGGLILAGLGLLVYWLVAVRPQASDFLIATEGEMKKVNWPSRKEVVGSTWVVIIVMFTLVALLFGADALFSTVFQSIGILEK